VVISRGTGSSNLVPSSGESGANLIFGDESIDDFRGFRHEVGKELGKLLREKPTLDEFPSTLRQIGAWTISSIRIRWSSDLDPGEGIEWRFVVETAFRLRDLLAAAGLDCWPKTTGVKGGTSWCQSRPT
jgi:hypothetical protein